MNKYWFTAAYLGISLFSTGFSHAAVTETFSNGTPGTVSTEQRTAGPAVMQSEKSARVERFVSRGEPSHRLRIPALSQEILNERLASKNAKEKGKRRVALRIGEGVDAPVAARSVPLASLAWETQSDGTRAAKIAVDAPNAKGFRVGYRISGPSGGVTLRFADLSSNVVVAGAPFENGKRAWAPTTEGETAIVEIAIAPGYEASAYRFDVEMISQLAITGSELQVSKAARSPSTCAANPYAIGCAGSCNIDLACVQNPSQALIDAARATMKIVYVESEEGETYLCSGTLLNSNASPRRPYVFTGAHCIDSQADAATVETFWFFDPVACGSLATPAFSRITTGASLRVVDENLDVSFIELNDDPPNGAVFASWDASVSPRNATVVAVHHPQGDLKAFSEGSAQGYGPGGPYAPDNRTAGSVIKVRWTPGKGTTEAGSSGSGVFTFNSNCNGISCYQLRGGLSGGAASCENPGGVDEYSRMDLMFTRLAPYLSPSSIIPPTTSSQATMVEFYNPKFDYYFMATRELEKSILDGARTGPRNDIPEWYR
ncbi:MAG: trypsin-like serine peptidase, partial [Casimicrobium sp.]